jgi:hypothetical protein
MATQTLKGPLTVTKAITATGGVVGAVTGNVTGNIAGAVSATTLTNSSTHISSGRITTTDGVASGTARIVGGLVYNAVSASDNLLASAGGSAEAFFAQTYSIPANTINAGTLIDIEGYVAVTNADGTDTLVVKLHVGGSAIVTSVAFDPSATTDYVKFKAQFVGRAAAGAAASCVATGNWTSNDTGTEISGSNILAPTNFATNGALVVRVGATWSATTALTNARLEMLNIKVTG